MQRITVEHQYKICERDRLIVNQNQIKQQKNARRYGKRCRFMAGSGCVMRRLARVQSARTL